MKRVRSVDCASWTPDLRGRYALFGELFGTLCVYGPLFVRGRTKNAAERWEKNNLATSRRGWLCCFGPFLLTPRAKTLLFLGGVGLRPV